MGGALCVNDDDPGRIGPGGNVFNAMTRLQQVVELRPELYNIDCGSVNFGDGNGLTAHTPNMLRLMAARVRTLGIKQEMEVFESGNLWLPSKFTMRF